MRECALRDNNSRRKCTKRGREDSRLLFAVGSRLLTLLALVQVVPRPLLLLLLKEILLLRGVQLLAPRVGPLTSKYY